MRTLAIERLLLVGAITLAIAALALVLALPSTAAADQHAEIEPAVQQYIEDRGEEFFGRCEEADVDEDIGKWCYEVLSIENGTARVQVGPTFSEFDTTLTLEEENGQWSVVDEEAVPPPGAPPVGNAGLVAEQVSSGSGNTGWFAAAGAAAVALMAGGLVAGRRLRRTA